MSARKLANAVVLPVLLIVPLGCGHNPPPQPSLAVESQARALAAALTDVLAEPRSREPLYVDAIVMTGPEEDQSLRHTEEWLERTARDPRVAGVCSTAKPPTCIRSELAAYLRFSLPAVVEAGRVRVDVAWVRHDPNQPSDFLATQLMLWSLYLQDINGTWTVVDHGPRLIGN